MKSERGQELALIGLGFGLVAIVLILLLAWYLIPEGTFETLINISLPRVTPLATRVPFPGQERFPESEWPNGPPPGWPKATWVKGD